MRRARPALSVVVVIYDMEREARRSLHSLSAAYQQGVGPDDYEVIVVDNGSPRPFHDASVAEFGPNFQYYYVHDANRSPARALNIGVSLARSNYLAVMIDGARILTPAVLRHGLQLPKLYQRPCGLTHGFHIGPDFQPRSILQGYDRGVEDRLLEQIGWPQDGYRLFEISSAHDPIDGWFEVVGESNCTFLHRDLLEEAGGFDERYVSAGGGLINLALQAAIYQVPGVDIVVLLGEGTFHQYHGGATSGKSWALIPGLIDDFCREFRAIHGRDYAPAVPRPHYLGHLPLPARRFLPQFAAAVELLERDKTIRALHAAAGQGHQTIQWLHAEVAKRDRLVESLRAENRLLESQLGVREGRHPASAAGPPAPALREGDA